MGETMKLFQLLVKKSDEIIAKAVRSLQQAPLKHYQGAGIKKNKQRLNRLFNFILECVKSKNVIPMIDHSKKVAEERFASGFDLYEVQVAFNVLEEAIWQQIIKDMQPSDYAGALQLLSTVLGAGKDSLANAYVTLVNNKKASSYDLSALAKGTDEVLNYH
jgi:hypothetical protein